MMRFHKLYLGCFLVANGVSQQAVYAQAISFSPAQISQAKITTVKLVPAAQAQNTFTLNGQAVWSSQAQSTISAPVASIIQQLNIENLQAIRVGQNIAVLHSPQLLTWQSELLQAQAQRDLAIPQAQSCLQPLQYVNAQVLTQSSHSQGWTVPSQALVKQNNQWYVFKQSAQGFEPIPIKVLSQNNGQALIDGQALQANWPIAVTGLVQIKAAWSGMGGE